MIVCHLLAFQEIKPTPTSPAANIIRDFMGALVFSELVATLFGALGAEALPKPGRLGIKNSLK